MRPSHAADSLCGCAERTRGPMARSLRAMGSSTPCIARPSTSAYPSDGVCGGNTVRAIKYLHHAGEPAVQRSAHQEALPHLTQGLALLATLPETPARVQQELV